MIWFWLAVAVVNGYVGFVSGYFMGFRHGKGEAK